MSGSPVSAGSSSSCHSWLTGNAWLTVTPRMSSSGARGRALGDLRSAIVALARAQ